MLWGTPSCVVLLGGLAQVFVSSTAFVSVGRAFLYKHETGMLFFLIKTKFYNPYLSGNTFATEIFKSNGYKTKTLFPHGYYWQPPIGWDDYQPQNVTSNLGGKIVSKILFEGYFKHDALTKSFDYENYLKRRF